MEDKKPSSSENRKSKIVELNVGGRQYATTVGTLMHEPSSTLAYYFGNSSSDVPVLTIPASAVAGSRSRSPTPSHGSPKGTSPSRHSDLCVIQTRPDGSYFIDRDGELFRYILDYLRSGKVILPENFLEVQRLREEARFYKLNEFMKQLKSVAPGSQGRRGTLPSLVNGAPPALMVHQHPRVPAAPTAPVHSTTIHANNNITWGYITVSYRGTFAFGRDGQADVKFRKLSRILVCGRAALCRDVFGDTLNESRDPDRGGETRYTSRLYLKYNSLEQAFDALAERGFSLMASCASGTCASGDLMRGSAADCEEQKWNHYNEFIFYRPRNSSTSNH